MAKMEVVLQAIRDVLGATGYTDSSPDIDTYQKEWRGLWTGHCDLVAKPSTVDQVSAVVHICHKHNIPVVPQGGNTGLVGGSVPHGGIVLSTERLNKIREIDPVNGTISCDSGVILADIQKAADDVDRLFPLSLVAEGSCRIGGNLSTNAGGVQVLRYGNTRDLALGLEVVLPDGQIWDGMRGLRKDNTGYDLKHMFIGSEGTLGVITGAVMKLYPKPKQKETCIVAFENIEKCIELFIRISSYAGDALTAFEAMNNLAVSLTVEHGLSTRDPFDQKYAWYALMELTSPREGHDLRDAMETMLGKAFEEGSVIDGVIAESESQRNDFWRIRETIPEAQGHVGASIKSDISVPISRVAEFFQKANDAMSKVIPGVRFVSFGHIGDGNLHYNLTQPINMSGEEFLAKWHDATNPMNDIVYSLNGSFSAEHGVGQLKRDELERYRSKVEIKIMKTVKSALDPKGIMNPKTLFKE
jgi:FAD/FMN-containing dehydrogenase